MIDDKIETVMEKLAKKHGRKENYKNFHNPKVKPT